MKNKFKKHISLLLAALLIICAASVCLFAFANDNVEINELNFPDENFRAAVSLMYDVNGDGILTSEERNTETMIVSGMLEMLAFELEVDEDSLRINDLTGIEYFDSLKSLRCSSIGTIEELDISKLKSLETFSCNDLGLKTLDVSSNSNLNELNACSNEFEALDLSANSNLKRVHCYSNDKLTELNLSGLTELEDLRCDNCALSQLDLSTNIKLNYLNCSYNHLIKLDLSNNTELVSDGRDITEYNLGYQQSEAYVTAYNGLVIVPMNLEDNRVAASSLDLEDNVAFSDGYFFTDDFTNMKNGIDYSYNTGISDSAFLTVHLDIIEKEHMYELVNFDISNNNAKIGCLICKDEYDLSFEDAINSKAGDNNYSEFLDVVDDGIINAKDFAKLVKEFN